MSVDRVYAPPLYRRHGEIGMSVNFLIGAILGSGIALFAGRAPTHRLVAAVQRRLARRPR